MGKDKGKTKNKKRIIKKTFFSDLKTDLVFVDVLDEHAQVPVAVRRIAIRYNHQPPHPPSPVNHLQQIVSPSGGIWY